MYVLPNFKTKKELKEAVKAGQRITIFQPGPFGGSEPTDKDRQVVEGPHYPRPHSWYAVVRVESGIVTKVWS